LGTDDWTLHSERDFEEHMREWLEQELGPAYPLMRLGLDLCILAPAAGLLRLVEFKAYKGHRAGGIGFGDGRGRGPQVDLLLQPPRILKRLEPTVRWCFTDLTRSLGSPRYALITSVQAKSAAMGGVARGRQNNFRKESVFQQPLELRLLLRSMKMFATASRRSIR